MQSSVQMLAADSLFSCSDCRVDCTVSNSRAAVVGGGHEQKKCELGSSHNGAGGGD